MANIHFIIKGPAEIDMLKSSAERGVVSLETKNKNKIEVLIKKTTIWNPRLFIFILELIIETRCDNSSPKFINAKAYYFSKTKKGFMFLHEA